MYNKLYYIILSLKNLLIFWSKPLKDKEIVFYSEGSGYWSHFDEIIFNLNTIYKKRVIYISSSLNDPPIKIKSKKLEVFYIGFGIFRTLFFATLNTKIFILTLPDLQNFHLKRSPNSVKYIYLHHSMVSSHMIYRENAFDNYDYIFAVGPHHIKETKKRELLNNIKQKEIIKVGYSRLDKIILNNKKVALNNKKKERFTIIIAPTWGKYDLLVNDGITIIENLINSNFNVLVRPHPRTIKHHKKLIEKINIKFKTNSLYKFIDDTNDIHSFYNADLMISDWSGVALEFAFGTERPIIYIDTPPKILNFNFQDYEIIPIEEQLREKIGVIVQLNELSGLTKISKDLIGNSKYWKNKIQIERKKNVFNIGNSDKVSARYINSLLHK